MPSAIAPWFKRLLTVSDEVLSDQFSLEGDQSGDQRTEERSTHDVLSETDPWSDQPTFTQETVPSELDKTKKMIEATFHLPVNKDIVTRDFTVGTENPWAALAVFVDGMADKVIINTHILQPLMLLSEIVDHPAHTRIQVVMETLLPGNQVTVVKEWKDAVAGILSGSTAVFFDGCDAGIIVETKGWEHRTVSQAQTENVVRGPHDAFTESFRANTGLVRARLRSEHLITEMMSIGKLAKTDVAVMYMHGLTNERLVAEVKRRISEVDVDYLADSGLLEQFIEDEPKTLVPQILSTERPDRIAHMLTEGHVAIFVGNSPFALAAPVVFWTLVHTPEDGYLRFPFGTFLRLIRWTAILFATLLPAFYISVANYHPEMLPTDLMLAIAGSREQVPFPVIVEVLMMEFAIELIREAGIRVPSVIGPTIGIVGALIIGQAAVQAGIVSPILVIVIATTALASFVVPSYNLNFGIRVMRFGFLIAAALFGFYGMSLLVCALVAKLAIQRSFGVPLLSPVAPSMDTSPDVLVRGTSYSMNERPSYLRTQNAWRQQPITRPWSAKTRPSKWSRFRGGGRIK